MKLIFLKPFYKRIISLLQPKQVFHNYERLGKEGDGGYVIPTDFIEDLLAVDLLSFGINDDSSFESNFLNNFDHQKCFAYDPSIDTLPENSHKNIEFEKLGIAKSNIDLYRNLNYFIKKNEKSRYVLKFDIEGFEWEILEDVIELQRYFPVIICELHFKSIKPFQKIFYPYILWKRYRLLKKLLNHYTVTFINSNNIYYSLFDNTAFPNLIELTLVSDKYLLDYYHKKTRKLCHATDKSLKHYIFPFGLNDTNE